MLPLVDTPPPLFQFQLQVVELADQVPDGPEQAGLVSTSARITIAGEQTESTMPYQTNTNDPGPEPIAVDIVRHTHSRAIQGSIQKQRGQWYWIGGGQRIPLAADDPCVTRVWPGGRSMSDEDFARFCRTRILEAPVRPGTVWTVNLTYDLATDYVTGDATGDANAPAGVVFDQRKDLGVEGRIYLHFNITAMNTRSFQRDIRPLFRDTDIRAMKSPLVPGHFDLSSYEDVKANASSIKVALNASETGQATHMPCNGWWPPGPLLVFKQWVDQGMAP